MKKFVSIFMSLVMVFTVVPNVLSRADSSCEGDNCIMDEEPLTVEQLCEKDPKNCATYVVEAAWNSTMDAGSRIWKKAVENWNWCMGDKKRCFDYSVEGLWNGTKSAGSAIYDWSVDASKWLKGRSTEAVEFKDDFLSFYNEKDENKPTWPFWALVGAAALDPALAVLLLGNCCCRRR